MILTHLIIQRFNVITWGFGVLGFWGFLVLRLRQGCPDGEVNTRQAAGVRLVGTSWEEIGRMSPSGGHARDLAEDRQLN